MGEAFSSMRRRRHSGLVALLACSGCLEPALPPLQLTSLDPAIAPPDTAVDVTIRGAGISPRVTIAYGAGTNSVDTSFLAWLGEVALGEVRYVDRNALSARVPATLPAGMYDLRVADPSGAEAQLVDAFTVSATVCSGSECPPDCAQIGEVCGDGHPCGSEVCDDGTNDASLGSCAVDCRAGPPAGLAFRVQPGSSPAGTPLAPTVEVAIEDSAGRLVRGASAAVSLSLGDDPSGGLCQLSGGGPLAAVDGLARFAALQLDTPGVGYSLEGSAAGLNPATSDGFDISRPWPGPMASWQYRKRIDIPSRAPSAALTDFPLLVALSDTDLRDRALATGFDIRFADPSGGLLEHELERYDSSDGSLVAWVKLPSLDTSADTAIYLYYGNASASTDPSLTTVWSNGFLGVWHLDEAGTGNAAEYADASGAGNDGTGGGGTPAGAPSQVLAKIGHGQDFDGQNDYIETTGSLVDGLGELTLSMWAFVRANDNTARPALAGQNDAMEMGFFWNDRLNIWTPGMTVLCPGKNIESLCTPDYGLGAWFLLAVTLAGGDFVLHIDGVEKHRVPVASVGSSGFPFNIGGLIFDTSGNHLDGVVDEVRLATSARSAEWLVLEHANQDDPASFYTVGPEEVR